MRSAIISLLSAALIAPFVTMPVARTACAQDVFAPPAVRPTLRARRATAPIELDGKLDEADWRAAEASAAFWQVEPDQGAPSRFRSTVRVVFDAEFLYIGFWSADSLGAAGVRVQDFRRDFEYGKNDQIGVTIDAIGDGKYNAGFQLTPFGTQRDVEVFDGGQTYNEAWDALWHGAATRTDSGWTAELAIPWSSLRYVADGRPWRMNFYRIARRANEVSGWVSWPRNFTQHRPAYLGDVTGIQPPPPTRNLRVRPYVIGDAVREGAGASYDKPAGRVGGEVTWAPTPNAVLDVTANTDFAQADVDRQVVNLRRFSVFFPERRPFFQENASVFSPGLGSTEDQTFVIRPYFSRRVGLDAAGSPVPIDGGARFVYRGDGQQLAALAVRQSPSGSGTQGGATFGVLRYAHNLGVEGRIGTLVAARFDDPVGATGATQSVVASTDFYRRFSEKVSLDAFVSGATSQGASTANGQSAYATLAYETPTVSLYTTGAVVGKGFNPPTGFVSRTDAAMARVTTRYDWRPSWRPKTVRRFDSYVTALAFAGPSDGKLQDAYLSYQTNIEMQNGAVFGTQLEYSAQRPQGSFSPVNGVSIPAGSYDQFRYGVTLSSDPSAVVSGGLGIVSGTYFDRSLTLATLAARFSPSPRLAIDATYLRSEFNGAGTRVRTHLVQPGIRLGLTPRMNVTSFYQYNTDLSRGTANVRYAWEFAPLSFLFVVFNDGATVDGNAPPPLALPKQQLVVKLSWLAQL